MTKLKHETVEEMRSLLSKLAGVPIREDAYVVWYTPKVMVLDSSKRRLTEFKNKRQADNAIRLAIRSKG